MNSKWLVLIGVLLPVSLLCGQKIIDTGDLLTGEEQSIVKGLKQGFRAYERQKPYRALKNIIDNTPSKKWVVFGEYFGTQTAGYQAELFIRTDHQALYYHAVKQDVRYRSFDPRRFDNAMEKSGGVNVQMTLTSQLVNRGCSDASYLRFTVSMPQISRIMYYYCKEPTLFLNLVHIVVD